MIADNIHQALLQAVEVVSCQQPLPPAAPADLVLGGNGSDMEEEMIFDSLESVVL